MSLLSMPSAAPSATTPADKEDSEDLFSAHDFDVQIEVSDLPSKKNVLQIIQVFRQEMRYLSLN